MHISPPPEPELALVIGEILHNLHSSLDSVVWQLTVPPQPLRPNRIQFPIFKDVTDVPGSPGVRGYYNSGTRLLKEIDPVTHSVVRDLQPCFAPDPDAHPLWLLNQLHNIDKHRTLLLVTTAVGSAGFAVRSGNPQEVSIIRDVELGPLEDGMEIYRLRVRKGADVTLQPFFSFKIALGETGLKVDPWPVTFVLSQLYKFVSVEVFNAFIPFFPRPFEN